MSHNKLLQVRYHWQLYHKIEGHNVVRAAFEVGCRAFVKGTGVRFFAEGGSCTFRGLVKYDIVV